MLLFGGVQLGLTAGDEEFVGIREGLSTTIEVELAGVKLLEMVGGWVNSAGPGVE